MVGTSDVIERRKTERRRCLLGARVVFNGRSSTLSCTVRNYSEQGALLEFGEPPYMPDLFEIVLDNRRTLMPGEIAWRRDRFVGIAFPRGQFMAELKSDAATSVFLLNERGVDEVLH
jgi:hypothetical protein